MAINPDWDGIMKARARAPQEPSAVNLIGDMTPPAARPEHVEGATEWWIQEILVALLKGLQRSPVHVLETGGFLGHTSERLLRALQEIGAGSLTVAEWDADAPERATLVQERLMKVAKWEQRKEVAWDVRQQDAREVIRSLPAESLDFVYLDDCHLHKHVDEELNGLFCKMRAGGLITGHDVHGVCDLQQEFKRYGGIALDFPRLGPAGGLGIIQV